MGKADDRRRDKLRAEANVAERRRVVLRVYEQVEATTTTTLAQLAARGVTPTCVAGCTHCCNLEIPTTRAEAETVVAWLREHAPAEQLDAIRAGLVRWLAWYGRELPAHLATGLPRHLAVFRHAPACPLLGADGRCGAYPVRPISCRNHYVTSPVTRCDPAHGDGEADELSEVARASVDHVAQIRRTIEAQGGTWLASVHLLQQWLAHLLDVAKEPWRDALPLDLGV